MSVFSTGLSREERKIGGVTSESNPFSPAEVMPLVSPSELEPLVVKPKVAWRLLSCSNTYGYGLLEAGELESFKDGKSRKITMASIKARIARQLEAAKAAAIVPRQLLTTGPPRHRPRRAMGRSRTTRGER
jgi:hypothetical protein